MADNRRIPWYDLTTQLEEGLGVPAGGTINQVLAKVSDEDNDIGWRSTLGGSLVTEDLDMNGFDIVNVSYIDIVTERRNVFIGKDVAPNTDGPNSQSNVCIGQQAFFNNVTGDSSVIIGDKAAFLGPNVRLSVAIGFEAMYSLPTGNYNIAVGHQGLYGLTSGNDNTAVGANVLRDLATGNSNVALGKDAGRRISTGANNIQCSAGVFLGTNTRPLANGSFNEIVIGADAIGNGPNTATIGNSSVTDVYFGNGFQFSDAAAPASATDTGNPGEIRIDGSFIYYCSAVDTWVRTPLSTW